jgi:3-deoxy-D-manno-octulosonic acid kinase
MEIAVHNEKSLAIAYDAHLVKAPAAEIFSVEYWQERQAMTGQAMGRGSAWFVDAPFGPVVLRHYLRGGWAAKVSRRTYLFTTVSRSRPFREFHILAALHARGLPVPKPVAALCEFQGLVSRGAILTARIPAARTLADIMATASIDSAEETGLWASVGACIKRFHKAGAWHADLNARNILLGAASEVFLIDFDRARFVAGESVNGKSNLNRLKRSLEKLWPPERLAELAPAWQQLEAGYHG